MTAVLPPSVEDLAHMPWHARAKLVKRLRAQVAATSSRERRRPERLRVTKRHGRWTVSNGVTRSWHPLEQELASRAVGVLLRTQGTDWVDPVPRVVEDPGIRCACGRPDLIAGSHSADQCVPSEAS